MKIKFIKELTEEELSAYCKSKLYRQSHQDYRECEIHLEYYKEYFGESWTDLSLVVFEKNDFHICLYMMTNGKELSFFGSPLRVYSDDSLSETAHNKAFTDLFAKISQLKAEYGFQNIKFYQHPRFLMKYYNPEGFNPSLFYETTLDLSLSEEELFMDIRKSYKSLINWGRKNIELKIFDASNMNDDIMCEFENFHIAVAKRRTRSHESWMLQSEAVKQNKGFIIFGYYNGQLATATLILNGETECYYGVCVNDRNLMAENLPIGHFALFKSILIAKEMGFEKFHFGDVTDNSDPKVNAIVKYKRGFSNQLYPNLYFDVIIQ